MTFDYCREKINLLISYKFARGKRVPDHIPALSAFGLKDSLPKAPPTAVSPMLIFAFSGRQHLPKAGG